MASALTEAPGAAAHAGQSREDQVRRRLDLGPKGVTLARIDEHHLAGSHFAVVGPVVELQVSDGDDQGHRYRVAMLGNILSRLQPEADDPHRSAVGNLLEAKGTPRSFRALP